MDTLFYLASDLTLSGATRQLLLLAAGLPHEPFRIAVGSLGPVHPFVADSLHAAGVPVHSVPVRNVLDVRGMRRLRQTVAAANPNIVHAWGPAAVRFSQLLANRQLEGKGFPCRIASAAATPEAGIFGWLTAGQLHRADRVIPATWAEAERYRRLGVPPERLTRIAPGVQSPTPTPDRVAFFAGLGLPPNARFVAVAGRLEPSTAMKAAVWAFDILRYEFPDLYLLIFGDGPDRAGLESFGRAIAFDDFRIRFPGAHPEFPSLIGLAEAVWVTAERGGVNQALEGMAAGRPVIGWQIPEMVEIVGDDCGRLVPPGDRAQIAARTHAMLNAPAQATAIGEAGRIRVAERFTAGHLVEQYARLYAECVR